MGKSNQFKVSSAGGVQPGYEESTVSIAVAELFGIDQDKALRFLAKERVIKGGLSESQAEAARAKLNSMGLNVIVANEEAANDPVLGLSNAEAPIAPTAFACPKCKTEQAASDECVNCGIIFSKYQHPRDRVKARKAAPKRRESESDGGFFSSLAFKGTLVALLAVLGALFFFYSGGSKDTVAENTTKGPSFTVRVDVSDKTKRLLDISGMNDTFDEMPENFKNLFERDFPEKAKARGTPPEKIELILSLVPNAFNSSAGQAMLGNWIDLRFSESEIDELLKIYETPSVERYIQAGRERNMVKNEAEFMAFVSELQNNPLTDARTRALERLIDAIALDETTLSMVSEVSSTVIKMSAAAIEKPDSWREQKETKSQVEQMQEMMEWMKPEVRAHTIAGLAWQLENVSTPDINMLNRAIEKPIHKEFFRKSARGFKEYFSSASLWLMSQPGIVNIKR